MWKNGAPCHYVSCSWIEACFFCYCQILGQNCYDRESCQALLPPAPTMVRFKNRHLLVEFLSPSSLTPTFSSDSSKTKPILIPDQPRTTSPDDVYEDGDELIPVPPLPFLAPLPEPSLKLGDAGGSTIYRAVRGVVQDVFGDEGWGRVASSFKGESSYKPYFQYPLTL